MQRLIGDVFPSPRSPSTSMTSLLWLAALDMHNRVGLLVGSRTMQLGPHVWSTKMNCTWWIRLLSRVNSRTNSTNWNCKRKEKRQNTRCVERRVYSWPSSNTIRKLLTLTRRVSDQVPYHGIGAYSSTMQCVFPDVEWSEVWDFWWKSSTPDLEYCALCSLGKKEILRI